MTETISAISSGISAVDAKERSDITEDQSATATTDAISQRQKQGIVQTVKVESQDGSGAILTASLLPGIVRINCSLKPYCFVFTISGAAPEIGVGVVSRHRSRSRTVCSEDTSPRPISKAVVIERSVFPTTGLVEALRSSRGRAVVLMDDVVRVIFSHTANLPLGASYKPMNCYGSLERPNRIHGLAGGTRQVLSCLTETVEAATEVSRSTIAKDRMTTWPFGRPIGLIEMGNTGETVAVEGHATEAAISESPV